MRVLSALLLAASLGAPARAQSLLPLGDDDVWTFGYVIDPPFADPDTVRFEVRVTGRVTIRDTAYAVARFPAVPTDTLRTDAEGRVWGRTSGRDALLFDPTLPDGAGYAWEGADGTYHVTVRRPVVANVPAGRFADAVEFSFDIPESVDDEFTVTLAAGVGVVRADSQYDGLGDLYAAEVGGRRVTPTEALPGAVSVVRAYPNPFAEALTVHLPAARWRSAEVVDALGRRVASLDVRACGAGCTLRWEADDAAPGLYVVRAEGSRGPVALPVVLAR